MSLPASVALLTLSESPQYDKKVSDVEKVEWREIIVLHKKDRDSFQLGQTLSISSILGACSSDGPRKCSCLIRIW